MLAALTEEEELEYRQALATVQKYYIYVLHKRNPKTGEWKKVGGGVRGLANARAAMEDFKKTYSGDPHDLRVIPKAYADTINEYRNIQEGKVTKWAPKRRRRPLLVLPEHM